MKRLLVLALSALTVISSTSMVVPAQSNKDAQRVAKMKRTVNKIGVDEKIEVKLLDGSKIKGRITEIGDQYFVLIADKTGDTRRLTYGQVKQAGPSVDTPFNDPKGWLAIALIPAIIGLSFWAKDKK